MAAFNMHHATIILMSVMIIEVASRCYHLPSNETECHSTHVCSGDILDIINYAERKCLNSYTGLGNFELTLQNPNDHLTDDLRNEHVLFLDSVISFKVSGGIPNNLNILDLMKNLKNLNLAQNEIKYFNGAPFKNMYRLEKIDLSHNKLSDIDELFLFNFNPNILKMLLLSFNNIKELSISSFSGLSSLVELDLSNNLISDLKEESFSNLQRLEILKLDNNFIKNLNGAFDNLTSLTHLFLGNNQIEHIDETSLKIIGELAVFDVSGNKLTEVSSIIFSRHWDHIRHWSQVCRISLSHNAVTTIPNASFHENLHFANHINEPESMYSVCISTEVDLSYNDIFNVNYNAFTSFVNLTKLDLSNNKLEVFSINNKNLEFVSKLNLSSNNMAKVDDESFASMKNLESLDLSNNQLENIPDNVFMFTDNLQYLNMANNSLRSISSLHLKMFSANGVLDLSNNALFELNIRSDGDIKIFNVLLHSNSFTDLQFIDLSERIILHSLDLSKNMVESLNTMSLSKLPKMIVSFDLSYNKLSYIAPGSFDGFKYLRLLYLNDNYFNKIEFGTFLGLSSLKTLDLAYNEIEYLDSKIMIDLKYIDLLYLQNNKIVSIDYTIWLGHQFNLTVYVDGNRLSCDWLGTALNDYNNGFSKMKLKVLRPSTHNSSIEGIACDQGLFAQNLKSDQSMDRLLVLVQKLLQAVNKQTLYLSNAYPLKLNYPKQSASKL